MRMNAMQRQFRFRMHNAFQVMTLAAFWLAIVAHGPAKPNALSQLALVVLPVAAFALVDRMWIGVLVGCFLGLLAPQP